MKLSLSFSFSPELTSLGPWKKEDGGTMFGSADFWRGKAKKMK